MQAICRKPACHVRDHMFLRLGDNEACMKSDNLLDWIAIKVNQLPWPVTATSFQSRQMQYSRQATWFWWSLKFYHTHDHTQLHVVIWFHFWKTPRDFSWIMLFIPLNKTTVSTCSSPQSPAAKTCWEHESHRPVSLAWQPISGLSAQASQCLALACRGSFGCWDWKLQGGMGRVDP